MFSSEPPRPASQRQPAGFWVILAGVLLFVILAAFAASDQNDRRARSEFRNEVDAYQADVERQLRSLQAVTLTMAASAATDSQPMTRERFDRMATALTGSDTLGALGAIALLERTDRRDVPAAFSAMRRQYPESDLQPVETGPVPGERLLVRNRWPVWMAYDAIGRDEGTRLQRVANAIEADRYRSPMLSEISVEETLDGPLATYAMLVPVIPVVNAAPVRKSAQPPLAAGGAGVRQWVSTLVLADELFRRPIAPVDARIAVHVVDVEAPDSSLQVVFDSNRSGHTAAARFSEERTLSAMGRTWQITYATTPAFQAATRDYASAAIGLSGLLVACGVLLVMLRLRRAERAASTEQALSEARFEQLNAMLPVGVFQADATGRLTHANEAACLLAAAPPASLIGRGYLRRLGATDRRWLLDEWRSFTATGEPFRAEHRLRCDDGRERWVLTEIVRQKRSDGLPAGFVGTCVDISTRRAFELDLLDAQQRAIAAEARLVAAIDAMDSAFALYGPDDRLVITNARAHGFFGSRVGEVRPGMHRNEVLHLLYQSLSGGTEPQADDAFRNRRDAFDHSKSGTIEERIGGRWFRVTRRRTTSGDFISLRSEITQQKLREQEIQKLAAVASQTADGVTLLDRQGRIQWVNASYERMTGYVLDEIRGLRGRDFLVGPMTDPLASSTIMNGVDSQQPSEVEIVHYTRQRDPVWFQVRNQPLLDTDGQLIGTVQTRFDIGERKAAEAAAKAALSEQRRAEARLRESIEALDAAFSLFDGGERLVVCNDLYLRMFGLAAGQIAPGMLKAQLLDLLWQQVFPAAAADGGADRLAERSAWIDARLAEFRAANGSSEYPIDGRWYSTTHRRTPHGDTVALRIDITDLRAREEEHRRLALVARETNDGVQVLDVEGRAIWVNSAFERLTGYAFEQVRGRRAREYLSGSGTHLDTLDQIDHRMAALLPYQAEILNYTRTGEPGWWDVRGQPLFDDAGSHLGYFETRFDITARKAAEAAADTAMVEQRRAETRLVQAIESLDEAFSLYDEHERLVITNEWNRKLVGDTGRRIRVGMTKREVLEIIADAHVPASEGLAARTEYIETRLAEHRSGNARTERRIGTGWYRISMRRTPLGDVVVTRADISEAREREAQLEKLSLVASRTANSVVIIDDQNRIEWVNESFERQTGYRMDEVLGCSPGGLLTGPLTDGALVADMTRMIAQGVGCRVELINYRKNGDPYWASIERQPIRDEQGRVVRWIRLSLDVSERKRAELALRSSESKNRILAAVVHQTTAAVITKDLDNRITTWNRGAERLYGYAAEQAIGRLSHEFLNPDATPQHLVGLLQRVRSGAADVNRLKHVRADGVRIDIESSHSPQLDDQGKLVGRITVIRDITEQLRAQRSIEAARIAAEHAQEAMSSFLSNMSHELRTPMHAILSYARLGQERIAKGTPEKTQQYLDRIEQSGVRLLSLLNDVLDLSRLEAGRLPIDPGRHELAFTVDAAIMEVNALAQSRQLRVERAGLRSLPAWYDPARIAQVLTNVIGNAVKFSTPGGVITIALGRAEAADGRPLAEVVIADSGLGIPESERESIFDKFVQSSKTRTGAGGTGLGLAISRELIHAHGGSIRAEDNPGGGARFVFTLPRDPPAALPGGAACPGTSAGAEQPDRRAA